MIRSIVTDGCSYRYTDIQVTVTPGKGFLNLIIKFCKLFPHARSAHYPVEKPSLDIKLNLGMTNFNLNNALPGTNVESEVSGFFVFSQ